MASEKAAAEKATPTEGSGEGLGQGPASSNGKGGPESETEMETAPLSPPASAVAMKVVKGSGPENEANEAEDPDATLTRPSPVMNEEVVRLCREVLAPLVHADGGELHLVVGNSEEIQIHLSGTCAGCPGAAMTRDRILAPVLVAALPKVRVTVTTGVRVPEGAVRVEAT